MYGILIGLLVLDCFALMVVVLLQSGKGGGLAAGFGGAGTGIEMMGSRQTATFLHNATKWLGGAFLVIAFVLSLMTVRGTTPRSLIETEMQREQQTAPAGEVPGGEAPADLQDMLEGGQQGVPAGEGAGQQQDGDGAGEPDQP
ncbi:MAG: preprotein translocase subunit SecG [Gemmatimonadota bacterium]|nr:preprotein translocase subunit SecG [Gemmatimonadota bacterium]